MPHGSIGCLFGGAPSFAVVAVGPWPAAVPDCDPASRCFLCKKAEIVQALQRSDGKFLKTNPLNDMIKILPSKSCAVASGCVAKADLHAPRQVEHVVDVGIPAPAPIVWVAGILLH